MADTKISAFTATTTLDDADEFVVNDSGTTKRITKASLDDNIDIALSQVNDVTATAAEVNILDGVTSTTAELNILDGVTATTAEVNILDGVTSTATEINQLHGNTLSGNNTGDETAAGILTKIKTVDGTSSGLDADLLDGEEATVFGNISQGTTTQDPDLATDPVILTSHANAPGASFWHIITTFYSNRLSTSNRGQIAIQYSAGNEVYARSHYSGTWTAWVRCDNQPAGVGVSQTWTDVTASRTAGTTYTNSGTRPITIHVTVNIATSGGYGYIYVGSSSPTLWISRTYTADSARPTLDTLTAVIPPGWTYKATLSAGSITRWAELS